MFNFIARRPQGSEPGIPGLQVYVVSCPKDLTMFEDALKTTGNEGKFVVKELIELVREALPQERVETTTNLSSAT